MGKLIFPDKHCFNVISLGFSFKSLLKIFFIFLRQAFSYFIRQ